MSLNGKTALVTGASRGIGRAIALRLAEDGANVAVIYAGSADKAEAVVNEITALGVNAKAYRCNVADSAAVNETVKAVTNDLGKIDILVNNAGITKFMPFLEVSPEMFDTITNVDLRGTFFCAQRAAKDMIRHGTRGCIINTSSVHRGTNYPKASVYGPAKAAGFEPDRFNNCEGSTEADGAMMCFWCDMADSDGPDEGAAVAEKAAGVIAEFGRTLERKCR